MKYDFIQSAQQASEIAVSLMNEKVVALDTETTGLDPHTDKVILLSLSTKEKTYLFDTRETGLSPFRLLLESENILKVGFNLGFDYNMIKGTGGFDTEGNIDLMLGEYCLMAGLQASGYSLEAVTKKYLSKERDKTLQKSFVGHKGEFTKDQLYYAAEDTADLLPIARIMQKEIKDAGVGKAWDIENKSLPAWADATFYGQKINVPAWHDIMEYNKQKMGEAKKHLDTFFEPFFDRDLFGCLDINYDSQQTVLYGLQKMGVKVDGEIIKNTNKETQKKLRNETVIQALEKYRQAAKAYGTYGQSYLDAIHPKTGRIHPRFNQYGTDTGRPSCRNKLNVLNIPRDKRFRNAFITDSDRLLSTVDYSGAELRIIADQSGDPLMIKGFNSGVDFHCFVATMLFNKEVTKKNENAHLRQPTKTINFGLAYGMSPARLYASLNGEGYKISMTECEDLFRKYKKTFATAVHWLDMGQREASTNLVMTNIVGRRRRWHKPNYQKITAEITDEFLKRYKIREVPEHMTYQLHSLIKKKESASYAAIEREGANFKVQSTNVEWTKESMYEIRKRCKRNKYDARMYNSVYDEIVLDINKKDAEAVYELQCKTMIECGQRYCKQVPVEVEGHLDSCWTK